VPREVVIKLQAEVARALEAPEVKSRLQAEGSRVVASTPEEYGAILRAEVERWAKVIKAAGIKVE
jgi:tripartite-type tricarboxylate transporter receptor subunit TctC